jgi:hypothetical protein
MRKNINGVRNKILAGFIFLLVLFTMVLLLQKLWLALANPSN